MKNNLISTRKTGDFETDMLLQLSTLYKGIAIFYPKGLKDFQKNPQYTLFSFQNVIINEDILQKYGQNLSFS